MSEAALQALVRFGPEESGLRAMRRDYESAFKTTVRQADAGARAVTYAIDRATPQTAGTYDAAGLAAAQARDVAAPDLNRAGVPASLRAAASLEQSGYASRLAESRAQAVGELGTRRLQAQEGAVFQKSQARRDLATNLTKLFERAQDLAGERGAFTVATAQQLRTAAQERADKIKIATAGQTQQERNSLRTAGLDPDTGDPIKGGELDPKAPRYKDKTGKSKTSGFGSQGLSADKHLAWRSDIDEIRQAAGRYKGKLSRSQIVAKLSQGRTQRTVLVDKQGNPLPEGLSGPEKVAAGAHKVTLPALPKFKPDLRMKAALDIALDGHLSRDTTRRLHATGFSIGQLGLPTFGDWKRKQTPARQTGQHAGALVNALGQILGLG